MGTAALGCDDIGDPLLLLRLDGVLLDGNAAAGTLLGHGLVGTNLADHVEDGPQRVREILAQQVRSTSPVPAALAFREEGGASRRVEGRRRSVADAVVVLRVRPDGDGFREITRTLDRLNSEIARRVQVEAELQRVLGTTVLELEEANERLRNFTSAVAHDLRSPLAAILGLASILDEDEPEPGDTRAVAERISRAARGCAEMTESMHADAEARTEAAVAPVDVAEVLDWVRLLNADEALKLEPVPPLPVVLASRVALRQVLLNLVTNAVKHRGEQEIVLVQVSAARRGSTWDITVSDDGPGVPDDQLDQVVRRGVQLDEARPGGGLGLDFCRSVVERYGGSFRLGRSERGGLAVHLTVEAAP